MFQNIYFLNNVIGFRIPLNRICPGAMFSTHFPYRESEASSKSLQSPNVRARRDQKERLKRPLQSRGYSQPKTSGDIKHIR